MPRAVPALLLGALLGVVPALSGPAAAKEVDQTYVMPGKGTVTLKGHGFGHGHGMSQYGAEGAAREGKTWREILKFYYPGTAWGTKGGRVKVLISADTSRDVIVAPNELIIPIGRAELHPTIRQPGTDERHVACLRTRGETTIVQGEKLAGEVRVAGGPQLP